MATDGGQPGAPTGPRVLFVDDEPNLLSGLRRGLHQVTHGWELHFAEGGAAALELMARTPIDAVVTDMRMPHMDGPTLLAEVQRRYPSTVRVVLSGEADRTALIGAAGSAHQFLSKPCDSATIVAVLNRAVAVRDQVLDPALRELIGGVGVLPTIPAVYVELVGVLGSPECSVEDVAKVLAKDVATSAEVLKLTNSAYFGLSRRIETVAEATSLLGLDTIETLVLAGSTFRSGGDVRHVDLEELRWTALRRSAMTRRVTEAEHWPQPHATSLSLAAMLRDVGALVLTKGRPDAATWLSQRYRDEPQLLADPLAVQALEREAYGCTIVQASVYLLGLWAFSPRLQRIIGGQPALAAHDGLETAEVLLSVAHQLAVCPEQPSAGLLELFSRDDVLDADRARTWIALCREPARAPGEEWAP